MRERATPVLRIALLAAASVAAAPAAAQTWPAKPVRLIHGFGVGSAIDIYVRPLALKLTDALGQSVIVDPRPGATGMIANELVARSAADGYTMLAGPGTSLTAAPHVQKVPFDTLRDYAPVAMITSFSYVLVAHPSVPAKSVKELIAIAKAKPGYLTFGSTGVGSGFHLAGELFAQMAGVKLLHVPYRGGGSAAIVDLVSGRVDLMWDNFGVVRPQVEAGKLRAIGTTGSRRIPALKDVPTIAESGLPGYDLVGWHGVLAPAGTPREIVDRMNAAINRALELPDIREQWAAQGVEVPRTTPAEFAARVKSDYQMYGRLVQSIGLKAQ